LIRRVLTLPKDRGLLRQRSTRIKTFDATALSLAEDLVDTWRDAGAYGLSGVQIGVMKRMMLFRDDDGEPVVVANPKVLTARGDIKDYDGCLSLPGIFARTRRPAEIELVGQRPDGSKYREHLKDFVARIALHELDHLEGIFFIDRLDSTDDLYTLESEKDESGEETVREVPLSPSELHFVEKEIRPLPGFALTV